MHGHWWIKGRTCSFDKITCINIESKKSWVAIHLALWSADQSLAHVAKCWLNSGISLGCKLRLSFAWDVWDPDRTFPPYHHHHHPPRCRRHHLNQTFQCGWDLPGMTNSLGLLQRSSAHLPMKKDREHKRGKTHKAPLFMDMFDQSSEVCTHICVHTHVLAHREIHSYNFNYSREYIHLDSCDIHVIWYHHIFASFVSMAIAVLPWL